MAGSMTMKRSLKWLEKLVRFVFNYRYLICLLIFGAIAILGVYLCYQGLPFKDTAQVCTGFLLVITIFFTALNYEFTNKKTQSEAKLLRETLTYTMAAEWHKSPIKDYQIIIIEYKNKFISQKKERSAEDFVTYIENSDNLEYKEALKGIINYFETIAIAAYRGLVDKDFIKEFHGLIFWIYYRDYYFYIEYVRTQKDNHLIWINFTSLVEEWHRNIISSFNSIIIT